ncbi:MAG TPA: HNH endonuclease domain-containing protein, partial [Candidatus Binatia bacterium]|nr:HNH endonuclease domain-containing protein [Candidatus Binatia bacterium]
MKRFTATEKWDDPWFFELSPAAKLLWLFICDHCDHAGVVDVSFKLFSAKIGLEIKPKHVEELGRRVERLDSGKFLIRGFVKFQYGKLSKDCKPHMPAFIALEKHGLNPDSLDQNAAYRNTVDDYTRLKVLERDEMTCVYTGKRLLQDEAAADHVVPRSKNGSNKLHNLVTTSKSINSEKGDLTLEEFCVKKGWDFNEIFQRVSKATMKGFRSLQDKEKDKDKDKDKEEGVQGEIPEAANGGGAIETVKVTAEMVYDAYPLKVGKQSALKSIERCFKTTGPEVLLERTKQFAAARNGDLDYCPHPTTWFNQGRFNDDPATWARRREAAQVNPASQRIGLEVEEKRLVGLIESLDQQMQY